MVSGCSAAAWLLTRVVPVASCPGSPSSAGENCTFRDFFILERSKTSEKRGQLGNNDRFRRPPIPSRIRQKLENPREIASSDIRKTRKVRRKVFGSIIRDDPLTPSIVTEIA